MTVGFLRGWRRSLAQLRPRGHTLAMMDRLLPGLRLHARALAALALAALLVPAFAAAPRDTGAKPLLIVCTADGLVGIPLGEDRPDRGAEPQGHCAACLRADPDVLPPPAAAPLCAAATAAPARAATAAAAEPTAGPRLRPPTRGPPDLA
jgi:hypothetical protein